MRHRVLAAAAAALVGCACAGRPVGAPAPVAASAALLAPVSASGSISELELVESWPEETTLDHPGIADARDVWPGLLGSARERIDLSEFYLSNQAGSALEPCVRALEEAAARGVKVRVLAEEKFYPEYPETLDRLAKLGGVEVRRIDWKRVAAGGVQHAKYFVVDGREAYLGSQNFDWRSLQHIQEVGVRFRAPGAVRALLDVFEADWAAAGGAAPGWRTADEAAPPAPGEEVASAGARVWLVESPRDRLTDPLRWDLVQLVRLIDGARRSLRVQVLTYQVRGHGEEFPALDQALRRAAGRGVEVSLLVSDWAMGKASAEQLRALDAWGRALAAAGKPGLSVKVIAVPLHSSGCIPFARVAHAKYLAADGERAWVGTSNWERDYFFASRNVGLVVEGGPLPAALDGFFRTTWASAYVHGLGGADEPAVPRKSCVAGSR